MSRILLPFETGALALPTAPVLYLNAQPGAVISAFDDLLCVQDAHPIWSQLPRHSHFRAEDITGTFALTLLDITRDRDQNRALIARAWTHTEPGGHIVLSGNKTDGIDALAKEARAHLNLVGSMAKSHGKVIWIERTDDLPDVIETWRKLGTLSLNEDGFLTAPGMFSHARVDKGSKLLARALPAKLGSHVVDLGAGWGYLASQVLNNQAVKHIDLIEASAAAIGAARANVTDARAHFHWVNALTMGGLTDLVDTVVMNPPFHTGRAADPALGQGFIETARGCLKPGGTLYMVANRQLPYEATLQAGFRSVSELASEGGFKVIAAHGPRRDKKR